MVLPVLIGTQFFPWLVSIPRYAWEHWRDKMKLSMDGEKVFQMYGPFFYKAQRVFCFVPMRDEPSAARGLLAVGKDVSFIVLNVAPLHFI